MKKKLYAAFLTVVAAVSLSACSACDDDADVASDNISKAADNFEVMRRVIFINTIDPKTPLLVIEGRCAIEDEDCKRRIEKLRRRRG